MGTRCRKETLSIAVASPEFQSNHHTSLLCPTNDQCLHPRQDMLCYGQRLCIVLLRHIFEKARIAGLDSVLRQLAGLDDLLGNLDPAPLGQRQEICDRVRLGEGNLAMHQQRLERLFDRLLRVETEVLVQDIR